MRLVQPFLTALSPADLFAPTLTPDGGEGAGAGGPAGGGDSAGGGQGGDAGAAGLTPDLSGLAPEVRQQVEPLFQNYESNATKKFMEHADYRKQWEPYEGLNLGDFEPEYLGELLEFSDVLENPEQFKSWVQGIAREHGEEYGIALAGEGGDPGDDGGDLPQTQAELDAYVQSKVQEAVAPISQQMSAQQETEATQQLSAQLDSQLDSLVEKDGIELDDEQRDQVFLQATRHQDSPDPVAAGYEDYKRLVGGIESGVLKRRADRPGAPEGAGGAPPIDPSQRPKDFKSASEMAKERVRQHMAQRA